MKVVCCSIEWNKNNNVKAIDNNKNSQQVKRNIFHFYSLTIEPHTKKVHWKLSTRV